MHQTFRNTDPAAWVPVIYSRSGYYLPGGIGFGGVIFRERKQTELCPARAVHTSVFPWKDLPGVPPADLGRVLN